MDASRYSGSPDSSAIFIDRNIDSEQKLTRQVYMYLYK
jgi:hypothetical protein